MLVRILFAIIFWKSFCFFYEMFQLGKNWEPIDCISWCSACMLGISILLSDKTARMNCRFWCGSGSMSMFTVRFMQLGEPKMNKQNWICIWKIFYNRINHCFSMANQMNSGDPMRVCGQCGKVNNNSLPFDRFEWIFIYSSAFVHAIETCFLFSSSAGPPTGNEIKYHFKNDAFVFFSAFARTPAPSTEQRWIRSTGGNFVREILELVNV